MSLDGTQVEEDDDAEGLAWPSVKASEASRSEGRAGRGMSSHRQAMRMSKPNKKAQASKSFTHSKKDEDCDFLERSWEAK